MRPVLGISLTLLIMPVSADERDMEKLLSMSLAELGSLTVTSSTLTEETLQTVPAAVSIYQGEDIRALGMVYLHQLAALVPGFQTQRLDDSGVNATLSARGRHLGASSREILVLIDGQRINDDWTGGTGFHDRYINIENAERIEFIRGPGSAIYGSNAMMGIINITTAAGKGIKLAAGHPDQWRASGQWHLGDDRRFIGAMLAHEQRQGQSYRLSVPGQNPGIPEWHDGKDSGSLTDVYLKAGWDEFSLSARFNQRESNNFYVVGYVAGDKGYADSDGWHINLGWQHSFDSGLELSGKAGLSRKDIDLFAPTLLATGADFKPLVSISGVVLEQEYQTEWILRGKLAEGRWLLGAEWRRPELIDTSGAIIPAGNQPPQQIDLSETNGRTIEGIFGQWQYPLTSSLNLTAGLRYDNYSDFGGHSSPRLALVQQLGEQDSLKLMYSEAFRAPSRVETSSKASDVLLPNPELRPEVAKTLELLWSRNLSQGLLGISLYDTRLKDAVLDAFSLSPLPARTWINGEQHIQGAELEWQYHFSPAWQGRLAASHIFTPGLTLNTEANSQLALSLSYRDGPLSLSMYGNWVSGKKDANEQDYPQDLSTVEYTELGSRTLIGLHLGWQWHPSLRLTLHADNLLDQHYRDVAIRPTNTHGTPGAGRSLLLGLEWIPR